MDNNLEIFIIFLLLFRYKAEVSYPKFVTLSLLRSDSINVNSVKSQCNRKKFYNDRYLYLFDKLSADDETEL